MKIIARVYENKKSKQKMITIPAKCNITAGDFVIVEKTKLKKSGVID